MSPSSSQPQNRWHWSVSDEYENLRADRAIVQAIQNKQGLWDQPDHAPEALSRSRIQNLIDDGQITRGGKALLSNEMLMARDEVVLILPESKPLDLSPESREDVATLFEDEHLIVVNKPQNLSVHTSDTESSGTLVNYLLHRIPDLAGIGGVQRPGIVHRIDKNTSGALVVAKTEKTHQKLVEIFMQHQITRKYWAVCYGGFNKPLKEEFRYETLIGRDPDDRMHMTTKVKEGKKAVSFIRPLQIFSKKSKPYASFVEARLETGRTHQVRVHLTALGHSIMGDPLYGKPTSKAAKWLAIPESIREVIATLQGQALHARVLGFKHPITGKDLYFEAEPPSSFVQLMRKLQGEGNS